MTAIITHKFVSIIPDGDDTSLVRPSNWNDTHELSGVIDVAQGGTGVTDFGGAGYVCADGVSPLFVRPNIPASDIDATSIGEGIVYSNGTVLTTGTATTDNLPQGSTNLYYSDDYVAALIQNGTGLTWTYDDLANALTGNVSLSSFTTDDLPQGSTNLYYSDASARDALSAGTGINYDNTTGVISLTTPVIASNGGTGIGTYAQGDIIYALNSTTLTTLAKAAVGTRYISNGGALNAPRWEQIDLLTGVVNTLGTNNGGTNIASYTQGDLLYASDTLVLSKLAKNTSSTRYLSNTGTNNNPAWAQIDLSNGVTGSLPVGNGGTGIASYTQGDLLFAFASNTLAKLAKSTDATRYLSNAGASNNPAWAQIDLSNGVTGTLPVGNGGTGTTTAFTAGSVVFAGASGVYSQDNTNFFWDDSNNRLGIGTTSPVRPIHISTAAPEMQFTDTDTSKNWHIGVNTNDFSITETGIATRLWCMAGGNIGFNGQSFGSGTGVIYIANCNTVPTTNPSGGGLLYVTGGALRYRGSSGTVANLASA